VYLGASLEVKLQTLDQLPLKDHIAGIPPLSYIVPFSLSTMPGAIIVECDLDLVFPVVELLLGGPGTSTNIPRELSEIEEEIMQDVTSLIARQAEQAWHIPNMALVTNRRIKSSLLHQYCPPNEKVTLVKFQVEIAGTKGSFQLVFPTSFLSILIKQIKLEQPQRKGGVRYFPMPSIRERVLDCDVLLAAGLPRMKVAVRDLIDLQPGGLLKLRAPVRAPGMLTAGGLEVFEAVPVRNGSKKAAQLGRRTRLTNWGME
jgi:flagellar motor switch protein FliM